MGFRFTVHWYALYSLSRVVYQHFPVYLCAYQSDIVQMIALLLPCVLRFGICQKRAMGFAFACLYQKDFNSRLVGMIIQLDAQTSEYQSYLLVLEFFLEYKCCLV
jgi:hypothetical protein